MGIAWGADIKVDFTMHVGRTGEAYFIEEKDDGADAGMFTQDFVVMYYSIHMVSPSGWDSVITRLLCNGLVHTTFITCFGCNRCARR